MRIISGKWGGRKLTAFTSDAIRPTTDRVKETIFNMIGPDIVGSKGAITLPLSSLSQETTKIVRNAITEILIRVFISLFCFM